MRPADSTILAALAFATALAVIAPLACKAQLTPCDVHSDCPPRRCDTQLGYCITPRPHGAVCTHDDQCASGSCTVPKGAEGTVCD